MWPSLESSRKMRILGISCFYHDSAAALVEDGKIIAAATEERFSRKKHDSGFPKHAIQFCLGEGGISSSELDWVVFYEKPFLKFERITLSFLQTAPFARESFVNAYTSWLKDKIWIKSIISKEVDVPADRILFTKHHVSHAAAAFFTSPFERCAILTVDGVGEWTTTAWGVGEGREVRLLKEIKFPHSLGLFYSAFTQFLGFRINDGEFKVMGLSPYGEPKYKEDVEKLIYQSADGAFKLDLSYFNYHLSDTVSYSKKFIDLFGKPQDKAKSDKVIKKYADIAASAQEVLEEKLLVIARNVREKTGMNKLCYSGGVALNGVANWRIFNEAGFEDLFIHPEAGDAGGALGAALYVYHSVLGKPRRKGFKSVYLGYENSEDEIVSFIQKEGISAKRYTDSKLVKKVANMLVRKKVIGVVRGRFEWGPRALGNRSILADPRDKKMKDLVNAKIKFREAFRPFAPVTTYEKARLYFDVGRRIPQPLSHMIAVLAVFEKFRSRLGAITHVDGTARPQFVKRSENPFYYDLINAFGKETGIYVLLNTSFNLKGEPIVTSCEDAYKTFMKSGLDGLVLGNYLIVK